MDFDCLRNAIALDGKQVISNGEFVIDELRQKKEQLV
jgi:hypothetical protein